MLYKDACNKKSNQKNLGTIKCSNLCTEIVEYTDEDEVAVCNLASISLPAFVVDKKDGTFEFDFRKLKLIAKEVTRNLNRVIDINYYPVPEAEYSNKRHRPIGMGVQVIYFSWWKILQFRPKKEMRPNSSINPVLLFNEYLRALNV